ncbi:hypothetical protein F4777DRAFT_537324 [Nemania sp. FL0916]|nr:hypothetical protein F4777DRAFT_537324 [Nemania sp. FL0916]
MADPENFEDDLFADLYDDNDASAPTAPVPVAAPAPAVAPAAAQTPVSISIPVPLPEQIAAPQVEHVADEAVHGTTENGYGDDYHEEAYDDEDDVDFDLGNGPATTAIAPSTKLEESPGPVFHTTRGPSAKEDGYGLILDRICQPRPPNAPCSYTLLRFHARVDL